MEKLITHQRAGEFIETQNHKFDQKANSVASKKNQKFAMLDEQDFDVDGVPDTIVTKEGKVFSFKGFLPKDTDYPLR
jgi:hypothetical protein